MADEPIEVQRKVTLGEGASVAPAGERWQSYDALPEGIKNMVTAYVDDIRKDITGIGDESLNE